MLGLYYNDYRITSKFSRLSNEAMIYEVESLKGFKLHDLQFRVIYFSNIPEITRAIHCLIMY